MAEEATFNGVPCITLNSYTEHIETVKVGTNELVAEDPEIDADMTNPAFVMRTAEAKEHFLYTSLNEIDPLMDICSLIENAICEDLGCWLGSSHSFKECVTAH